MEKQLYIDDEKFTKIIKILAKAAEILTDNQTVIFKLIIDASENLSAEEKHDLTEQIKVATGTLRFLMQSLNGQFPS